MGRGGGGGVPGGKDRRGERKGDTLSLGPQPAEKLSLTVPCNGTGHLWWTARRSTASWRTTMAPPVKGSQLRVSRFLLHIQPWRTAAGSGLPANGADFSAPSLMAATPPRFRSTTASLTFHLFFYWSSNTASGSHWRSPLLPAARSPQHRDPPQQRELSDSMSLLPAGFRHQCNTVRRTGRRQEPANI